MQTINSFQNGLIIDHDMGIELTTDPIEIIINLHKKSFKLSSIMIHYYDVYPLSGGTPDGLIEIYGSIDTIIWSKVVEYEVNSTTNIENAISFANNLNLDYLKIKYIPNNIAFGKLNANALYHKWNLIT